jgi:hypothetical protein
MTRSEIIDTFGQSVYEIWLQVAIQYTFRGSSPRDAFLLADQFVAALKEKQDPRQIDFLMDYKQEND